MHLNYYDYLPLSPAPAGTLITGLFIKDREGADGKPGGGGGRMLERGGGGGKLFKSGGGGGKLPNKGGGGSKLPKGGGGGGGSKLLDKEGGGGGGGRLTDWDTLLVVCEILEFCDEEVEIWLTDWELEVLGLWDEP